MHALFSPSYLLSEDSGMAELVSASVVILSDQCKKLGAAKYWSLVFQKNI
jgi:hypothetical protein